MNLLMKFGLAIALVFGLTLTCGGMAWRDYLQQHASAQVLQQAQLMIEAARAMRTYTLKQIQPLVGVRRTSDFHPQWVPFYAASQIFQYLSAKYPDYTYKEATLNPTNPRDHASGWEVDVVQYFRDHPDRTEVSGERDSLTGRSLYLAHPIVAEAECLECHGSPAAAPPKMLSVYGPDNGFGWKRDEVVGAQIVSVPTSVPNRLADAAFLGWLESIAGAGAVTLGVVALALTLLVNRPVGRIRAATDELAAGRSAPELPERGRDEIAALQAAFNRLRGKLGGSERAA